jgi:hypothetical protein
MRGRDSGKKSLKKWHHYHHFHHPSRSCWIPTTTKKPADFIGIKGENMNLKKLGFRRKKKSITDFFRPPSEPLPLPKAIKPDVDYPNHDERTPQAPAYAQMWNDHFNNMGNVKNPLGSPLESGA